MFEIIFYIFFGLFVLSIAIWILQFAFFVFLVAYEWINELRLRRAQKIVDKHESC